ncbi:DUF6346 domain-containing protein [Actinoalloteichus caeruleus]|uniref:DUF6346 domain-containing protein n=1 Tax=Actinoalloteichus cyanogriseus TaxID=2893586 RepID=UPI0012DF0415|nr:DUF6346 domain-containing protein [Actinoalloteichus caeruleus]
MSGPGEEWTVAEISRGRKIVAGVVLGVVGLTLFALLFPFTTTLHTWGGTKADDRPVVDAGTAEVTSCRSTGPISLEGGIGPADVCTAEIHWSDGRVEHREAYPRQLTREDLGTEVPVEEVQIVAGGGWKLAVFRTDRSGAPVPPPISIAAYALANLLVLAVTVGVLVRLGFLPRPEREGEQERNGGGSPPNPRFGPHWGSSGRPGSQGGPPAPPASHLPPHQQRGTTGQGD